MNETAKQAARERGQQLNLPYAGALRPQEAFLLMQAGAKLIDVRTQAELYWVGRMEQLPGRHAQPGIRQPARQRGGQE